MSSNNISFDNLLVTGGTEKQKCNQAISYILERLHSELKDNLYYHGVHHTLDVMNACQEILKEEQGVSEDEANLLMVAAAFHDCGFLSTYRNHEEAGCEIAREYLTKLEFKDAQIQLIESIIMSTKLPQSADNKLDQILCDADLDYLGGNNFDEISNNLRREFLEYNIIDESVNWTDFQLDFFYNHHYWTAFSIKHRKPAKDLIIKKLEAMS